MGANLKLIILGFLSAISLAVVPNVTLLAQSHEEAMRARQELAEEDFLRKLNSQYRKIQRATAPSIVNILVYDKSSGSMGSGSGWIYSQNGIVVTAAHVLGKSEAESLTIYCTLSDGSKVNAVIVGRDEEFDIGVLQLKLDDKRPLPIELGYAEDLSVGDQVFAFGSPLGMDFSMSAGIVASLERRTRSINPRMIQVDADINPGNSGGPLVDVSGALVGMVLAIQTTDGGSVGIALAIPTEMIAPIVEQLVLYGELKPGVLGVAFSPDISINRNRLRALGFDGEGVLISGVKPGGPAEQAGLRSGDILTSLNGQRIRDSLDLRSALRLYQANDSLELSFFREENLEKAYARMEASEVQPDLLVSQNLAP